MIYIYSVQHIEFVHKHHFEFRYHRKKAQKPLSAFIDFFWETDFDELYKQYPQGFSDALFPNIGYTYLINLGTPFVMQLEKDRFEIRSDAFLPRHKHMNCHHSTGNKIFGIKFKISPVLFEKKINFSEYREYMFSLAYLIDRTVVEKMKAAASFNQRMQIISEYYEAIIKKYHGSIKQISVVSEILSDCSESNSFDVSLQELSNRYSVSSRTMHRYFEATTSLAGKDALQILRIRKAVELITQNPAAFKFSNFGYYDYSHFYKHLKQFLSHPGLPATAASLQILKSSDPGKLCLYEL